MRFRNYLNRIIRDEAGATAMEYGLILAMIVLAMFAALSNFAGQIQATWNSLNTAVSNADSQAGT